MYGLKNPVYIRIKRPDREIGYHTIQLLRLFKPDSERQVIFFLESTGLLCPADSKRHKFRHPVRLKHHERGRHF